MSEFKKVTVAPETNLIPVLFGFRARNSRPNVDANTSEFRRDEKGRVFCSDVCMKQIIKYGVDCDNKKLQYANEEEILASLKIGPNGKTTKRSEMEIMVTEKVKTPEEFVTQVFDLTAFGDVATGKEETPKKTIDIETEVTPETTPELNLLGDETNSSNKKLSKSKTSKSEKKPSLFRTSTGFIQFVIEPTTITCPQITNGGYSIGFRNSGDQAGTQITQVISAATFLGYKLINVYNWRIYLRAIIKNEEEVEKIINRKVNRAISGLWTGLQMCDALSRTRRGIEPLFINYAELKEHTDDSKILMLDELNPENKDFESFEEDLRLLKQGMPQLIAKFGGDWKLYKGENFL